MLKLDSASEVSELNEGNNELLVTIRYTGRCGLTTMPPTPRIIATPPSREKATKAPVSKFAPTLKQGGFKPLSPSE